MKATFIIVLINLAIVCYGLSLVEGYIKESGEPNYCTDYELDLEKGDTVKAYSTEFCRSLSCYN